MKVVAEYLSRKILTYDLSKWKCEVIEAVISDESDK